MLSVYEANVKTVVFTPGIGVILKGSRLLLVSFLGVLLTKKKDLSLPETWGVSLEKNPWARQLFGCDLSQANLPSIGARGGLGAPLPPHPGLWEFPPDLPGPAGPGLIERLVVCVNPETAVESSAWEEEGTRVFWLVFPFLFKHQTS